MEQTVKHEFRLCLYETSVFAVKRHEWIGLVLSVGGYDFCANYAVGCGFGIPRIFACNFRKKRSDLISLNFDADANEDVMCKQIISVTDLYFKRCIHYTLIHNRFDFVK